MTNEEMFKLLQEFKADMSNKGLSPLVSMIANEILDIFYIWFAKRKEKHNDR